MKKSRVGVGLLLMTLGLLATVGPVRPGNADEAVGFYGLATSLIMFGLWFTFRGVSRGSGKSK